MDENKVVVIPPWLVKRGENDKCVSTKYTVAQCTELDLIKSLYLSICFQYEPPKGEENYLIFFQLREKNSQLFESGYYPITEFRYWQSLIQSTPLCNSLQSIVGHLCGAQLSVNQRLNFQGHSFGPSTMMFEEVKSWAVKIARLKVLSIPLRDELLHRKRLFFEASLHPELFKELPEFAEALYKCGVIIDKEILPCVNASLTQHYVKKPFLSFKGSMRELLDSLVKFIFHVFRDTEYVAGKCNIKDLQDPTLRTSVSLGGECETTVSGKLLLRLVVSPVMQVVFQDDGQHTFGNKKLCENSFTSEDGSDYFSKTWNMSSGKGLTAIPVGILSFFKKDPKLMQRFIQLHVLSQKMAIFYVIFQTFVELRQDCRHVLKEMREVMQHYKELSLEWGKCVRELYAQAESYLVKARYIKNDKEVECWQRHFDGARNSYDTLLTNLSLSRDAVYEFEKIYHDMEPIPPLNQVRESLEQFFELMNYFTGKLKSAPLQGESRDLLLSPSAPQRGNSAPSSRVSTPQKNNVI